MTNVGVSQRSNGQALCSKDLYSNGNVKRIEAKEKYGGDMVCCAGQRRCKAL